MKYSLKITSSLYGEKPETILVDKFNTLKEAKAEMTKAINNITGLDFGWEHAASVDIMEAKEFNVPCCYSIEETKTSWTIKDNDFDEMFTQVFIEREKN